MGAMTPMNTASGMATETVYMRTERGEHMTPYFILEQYDNYLNYFRQRYKLLT